MISLRVHCDPDEADSWQVRGCDIAIQRRAAEAQRHRTIAGLDLKTPAFWTAVTHWRAGGLPRSRNSRPHRASRGSADAGWFHRPPDVGATRGAVMLVAPASRRRWWCTDAGWSYRPRMRKRPLSRSLPRTLPSSPAFWSAVTHWRPGAPASHHKRALGCLERRRPARWWCTDAGWSRSLRIRNRPLPRTLPRSLPSSPAFWSAVTLWRPSAPASHHRRGRSWVDWEGCDHADGTPAACLVAGRTDRIALPVGAPLDVFPVALNASGWWK